MNKVVIKILQGSVVELSWGLILLWQ